MVDISIISDDVVGEKMAGPGIRAWEMARCLSEKFTVILAIPDYSYKSDKSRFFDNLPFEVFRYSVGNPTLIHALGERSRILLVQGYVLSKFPALKKLNAHLIVDLYVPFVLENLFVHKWKVPNLKDREFIHLNDLRVFNDQLLYGDHFLCANSRQKDLFVGSLLALNRINPRTVDSNLSLDGLISIVPFGISETGAGGEARGEPNVIRKKIPQVREDDIVLLWGGVISNWFDPATLIHALKEALAENGRLKLFFLSTKHPNPLLPEFDAAREAVRTADALGLNNRFVFFNEDWVGYDDRSRYFQEADIGVSIHKCHFETRFSFRTRILDYIKHGLPVICTEGDYFAELVERERLGTVVRPEDAGGLKQAILGLAANAAERQEIKRKMDNVKKEFLWKKVTEPLVSHCRRVLSGEIRKRKTPDKKEILFVCTPKAASPVRKFMKRYLWASAQKIPPSLSSRLRRLLRFLK